jgi:hypothetical protein
MVRHEFFRVAGPVMVATMTIGVGLTLLQKPHTVTIEALTPLSGNSVSFPNAIGPSGTVAGWSGEPG